MTVNLDATPLNVTADAPVKALPEMVTVAPTFPELGLKEETVGITPKDAELVPIPDGVVTAIGPVSAPDGTAALICVSETTMNLDATPLKVTAEVPVKALPETLTEAPTGADAGETAATAGAG
jgi:hypothetical protein